MHIEEGKGRGFNQERKRKDEKETKQTKEKKSMASESAAASVYDAEMQCIFSVIKQCTPWSAGTRR